MPPRTSEGDGKGTARLAGGRWPVAGGRMGRERRMCRRKVDMVPNGHPGMVGHSSKPVCSWDSSSPPPTLTRPPYRDGLRRQVSATTGIPDLDSVSFCTFFPRHLFGLLGQGARLTVSVPCSIQPAMQVSPSSLRLLFPAPLCSQAWNLNFLHLPIYTLPVYFFFLSSR